MQSIEKYVNDVIISCNYITPLEVSPHTFAL